VRNQLPSWLGGGSNKASTPTATTNKEEEAGGDSALKLPGDKGHITPDKDSDASSATGGADSEKEVCKGEVVVSDYFLLIQLKFVKVLMG